jgi:TrmH family RNA methyltransferase
MIKPIFFQPMAVYICLMHKNISSLQNPLVKQFAQLREKSRERRKSQLFTIEGERETLLAIKGGYRITHILFSSEIVAEEDLYFLKDKADSATEFIEISTEVYDKLAYRNSTEGILALAQAKSHSLESLQINRENPLLLIAEAPEKPGNIGALLRTADAANIDAVLIANALTDLYNPNIVRSSVGCLFTTQVATASAQDIIEYLDNRSIAMYCAALQASVTYTQCDFTGATAIVVGTEATGLSKEWLRHSSQNIIIPMQGEIDSMNVSVAAGILIFEAKRQRKFN